MATLLPSVQVAREKYSRTTGIVASLSATETVYPNVETISQSGIQSTEKAILTPGNTHNNREESIYSTNIAIKDEGLILRGTDEPDKSNQKNNLTSNGSALSLGSMFGRHNSHSSSYYSLLKSKGTASDSRAYLFSDLDIHPYGRVPKICKVPKLTPGVGFSVLASDNGAFYFTRENNEVGTSHKAPDSVADDEDISVREIDFELDLQSSGYNFPRTASLNSLSANALKDHSPVSSYLRLEQSDNRPAVKLKKFSEFWLGRKYKIVVKHVHCNDFSFKENFMPFSSNRPLIKTTSIFEMKNEESTQLRKTVSFGPSTEIISGETLHDLSKPVYDTNFEPMKKRNGIISRKVSLGSHSQFSEGLRNSGQSTELEAPSVSRSYITLEVFRYRDTANIKPKGPPSLDANTATSKHNHVFDKSIIEYHYHPMVKRPISGTKNKSKGNVQRCVGSEFTIGSGESCDLRLEGISSPFEISATITGYSGEYFLHVNSFNNPEVLTEPYKDNEANEVPYTSTINSSVSKKRSGEGEDPNCPLEKNATLKNADKFEIAIQDTMLNEDMTDEIETKVDDATSNNSSQNIQSLHHASTLNAEGEIKLNQEENKHSKYDSIWFLIADDKPFAIGHGDVITIFISESKRRVKLEISFQIPDTCFYSAKGLKRIQRFRQTGVEVTQSLRKSRYSGDVNRVPGKTEAYALKDLPFQPITIGSDSYSHIGCFDTSLAPNHARMLTRGNDMIWMQSLCGSSKPVLKSIGMGKYGELWAQPHTLSSQEIIRVGGSEFCVIGKKTRTKSKFQHNKAASASTNFLYKKHPFISEKHSDRKRPSSSSSRSSNSCTSNNEEMDSTPKFLEYEELKEMVSSARSSYATENDFEKICEWYDIENMVNGEGFMLVQFTRGPMKRHFCIFRETDTTIGSAQGNHVPVAADALMSSLHCIISYCPDRSEWKLIDIDSENGTYLKLTMSDGPVLLQRGDLFTMGNTQLKVLGVPHASIEACPNSPESSSSKQKVCCSVS